ncbi:chorismate--pyruvate lyase family protein [Sphingomonas sp.]|uniref:chorismate--pyruvate lyase family protein n=1 Tax=Sphingomonas sp. TaxID=28214 RepID=UPI002FD920B6
MLIATVAVAAATEGAAELSRDLLASPTATAVLERRCGGPIRAEVDRQAHKEPSPEQRKRLGVGQGERVAYRSVVLSCAGVAFSIAENWYVPSRLTPDMNAALEQGDTPFGAVIRPLHPHRKALEQVLVGIAPYVLRHRALVLDGEGRTLAEVVENYTAAVLR